MFRISLAIFATLALLPAARAQQPVSQIQPLAAARTDRERYFSLGPAARANLELGHLELARAQAEELDRLRAADSGSWNLGNAIEDVNVVLGRLAGCPPENHDCRRGWRYRAGRIGGSSLMVRGRRHHLSVI